MSELFTAYLIALFLMLILIIRTIRQINAKKRAAEKIVHYFRTALTKAKDSEGIHRDAVSDAINEYEADIQRLKYYKVTAYIVAFTLTYCIVDCLLFNI